MGPQLYRCGNDSTTTTGLAWVASLQWGRNFIVAETRRPPRNSIYRLMLQWGRNFIVAETRLAASIIHDALLGFNGAATLSLRKPGAMNCKDCDKEALQWGRNFIVAETTMATRRPAHNDPASMGPQLYRCGNNTATYGSSRKPTSFNGAATLSLRKPGSSVPQF